MGGVCSFLGDLLIPQPPKRTPTTEENLTNVEHNINVQIEDLARQLMLLQYAGRMHLQSHNLAAAENTAFLCDMQQFQIEWRQNLVNEVRDMLAEIQKRRACSNAAHVRSQLHRQVKLDPAEVDAMLEQAEEDLAEGDDDREEQKEMSERLASLYDRIQKSAPMANARTQRRSADELDALFSGRQEQRKYASAPPPALDSPINTAADVLPVYPTVYPPSAAAPISAQQEFEPASPVSEQHEQRARLLLS